MRINGTLVTAGLLSVAATAAITLGAAAVPAASPRIVLADNGIAVDPTTVEPGDGSLSSGQTLTPFDVQNPAIGRLAPAMLSAA